MKTVLRANIYKGDGVMLRDMWKSRGYSHKAFFEIEKKENLFGNGYNLITIWKFYKGKDLEMELTEIEHCEG